MTKTRKYVSHVAFTMAEILLSLTIIGVVAAITLPSLTGNINERTWNTQRKALYARMSQAISLMPALNGYGTLTEKVGEDGAKITDEDGNNIVDEDTAAETFITAGLSKVLKINNICSAGNLSDCGIPESITTASGVSNIAFPNDWKTLNAKMTSASYATGTGLYGPFSHSLINAAAAAFETANGESIAVFYQPNCKPDMGEGTFYMIQSKVCANFIYDLNGTKGPNTVGKDIGFMTVLYPTDAHVVAPNPIVGASKSGGDYSSFVNYCREQDNSRLPIREELASIFVNKQVWGLSTGNYISATTHRTNPNAVYHLFFEQGVFGAVDKGEASSRIGLCVKRN